jgi:ribosomal-protein-alanine N-acetyltransferase
MTITLSRTTRADAGDLIAANIASRAYHAPWLQPFTDMAGFEEWYAKRVTGPNVGLLAREEKTGGIVGVVNLSEIVMGVFKSAYLGYYGMAAFAGRGLMTAAVRQAVWYGFTELGLHRVEANIQPGNTASIALARRIGFRREGFSPEYLFINGAWADCERWALLARELPAEG